MFNKTKTVHNFPLNLSHDFDKVINKNNIIKPDFDTVKNIENDAIILALNILQMSYAEYNYMSVQDLKNERKKNNYGLNNNALNILIYYKSNSLKSNFKQTNLLPKNIWDNFDSTTQIFPDSQNDVDPKSLTKNNQENKFDDIV